MKRKVYDAITKSWEYYKKHSLLHPIDWDVACKESADISFNSPVPELMRDLFISIQDQLHREEKEANDKMP